MEVYIHLGIHKTASTFLQKNIFPQINDAIFLDRSLCKELKQYILYTDDFEFDSEKGKEIFNRIISEYKNYKKVIISDEEFYCNPYMGAIDRKRNLDRILSIFGQDTHFLIFIRNQNNLLLSLYSYYIKTGGTASLTDFISYKKYPLRVDVNYFLYDKYLKYIIEKTSLNNLQIILFEEFVENQKQTIDKICTFFNSPLLEINLQKNKVVNSSLSYNLLNINRFINKFLKSSKSPFSLLPLIFHRYNRKIFESIKLNDKKAKKKYLIQIADNKEFNNMIIKSNNSLSELYNKSELLKYKYPF